MAPVGRWQKNKDLTWYTKRNRKDIVDEAAAEREAIRKQDAEALNEFMGIKRKDHGEGEGGSQHQLENLELKALLAREGAERDAIDVERVQGLGAAPSRGHEHIPTLTLREKEIARREKAAAEAKHSLLQEGNMVQVLDLKEDEQRKAERKAAKKERKKEKKERKREKKETKRRKKDHHHHHTSGMQRRHGSSLSSNGD